MYPQDIMQNLRKCSSLYRYYLYIVFNIKLQAKMLQEASNVIFHRISILIVIENQDIFHYQSSLYLTRPLITKY